MLQAEKSVARRKLGEQERYLHNLHRFGGLIAVTVLDIEGPLSAELVRRALDWMQKRHPIMQAHIRFEGFGRTPEFPWFFRQPLFDIKGTLSIPLRTLTLSGEAALFDLVQTELKTPIKGKNSPRLRAVFLPNWQGQHQHKLILSSDHTISDAQANCRAIKELMGFFDKPEAHENDPVRTSLPASLEMGMPKKPKGEPHPYQSAIRLPTRFVAPKKRQSPTLSRQLTLAQTDEVKAALKKNRATMNGLLAACMLKNLGERHGLNDMTCLSNVELRRMCKPPVPLDSHGCYIDILRTRHDVTQPVWALAGDVTYRLISTLVHDQAAASQLRMPHMDLYKSEGLAMVKSGMRLDALAVTTAGETGLNQSFGRFKLNHVQMNMSLHVVGATIFLISFEREGALHINMCFSYPNLDHDEANSLLDQLVARLLDVSKS